MSQVSSEFICNDVIVPLICKLVALKNNLLRGDTIDPAVLNYLIEFKKILDKEQLSNSQNSKHTEQLLFEYDSDDSDTTVTPQTDDEMYDIDDESVKKILDLSTKMLTNSLANSLANGDIKLTKIGDVE